MFLQLRVIPFCLSLSPQPSNYVPKRIIAFRKYTRERPQISRSRSSFGDGVSVFVVSDLHTDYPENMTWVKSLSSKRHNKKDVLLVAGDVAETCSNFFFTMSLLKDTFQHVFYVPGNHDLWCRWDQDRCLDSLEKLNKLLDACRILGVETTPMILDGLGIIPLFSWYHEVIVPQFSIFLLMLANIALAYLFYRVLIERRTSLASEYRPWKWQELCPEKRMLFYPNLPKIIGSDCLEDRIRLIHGTTANASMCHVFGHTHFCWDAMLDGVRYVQAPLAYPRERKRRMNGGETWLPFCIYADGKFAERLSPCYWSDYYAANPREPHNSELAPWVARFYNRLQ
ncbi:acyl-carrier-protein phosphodiesterase PptH isoform X3 [Ricinus communis]|uniref:acyl-carrier-protein phosphodiesterase PptH isoform X3 n=1 Tax=Ricinus communis TaxID=3988 RepID=UPI00077288E3|nr:acyl-carrier-protein phosphodiesterase PptH isoform X3 [Ricinus communis]|eukprot:XP_015578779.1 uncharacterized protein LOC8286474 isoform X4 [Ricinus communis]